MAAKRILVAPLDWGLGHATRCIPIITALQELGAEVVIAADRRPAQLLRKEFPALEHLRFPGYEIEYPEQGNMAWTMFRQLPKLAAGIAFERRHTEELVRKYRFDAVISDNRWGVRSDSAASVLIIHQLRILLSRNLRRGQWIIDGANSILTTKFRELWVPDNDGPENILGDLAAPSLRTPRTSFIGPISRLRSHPAGSETVNVIVIISGPEPQRTLFERMVTAQLLQSELTALIVRGVPEEVGGRSLSDRIRIVHSMTGDELSHAIASSEIVVARSGFSTIMDMAVLGKNPIFVPTPQQTEQEYLAVRLRNSGICYSEPQQEFDLKRSIEQHRKYTGFLAGPEPAVRLKDRMEQFLASL
jgi:uncharacterized protein (TIGR00661 family)